MEFWGDEITDIRQFSVADQRTIPEIEVGRVDIFPARELPITDAIAKCAADLAVKHPGNPALVELLTKVSEHIPAEGMEALLPALSDAPMITLPEILRPTTHVVMVGPEKIRRLSRACEHRRVAALERADLGRHGIVRGILQAGVEVAGFFKIEQAPHLLGRSV